jgi:hypothetical protein
LIAKLKDLSAKYTRLIIVGHSFGGLVTSKALAKLSKTKDALLDFIPSVYFGGVPFGGSILAVRNLIKGRTDWPISRVLTQKAMASFASCYEMIPREPESVRINKTDISSRLFVPRPWVRNKWGLFKNGDIGLRPATRATRTLLSNALKLHDAIAMVDLPATLKIYNIVSKNESTPIRAVWRPKKNRFVTKGDKFHAPGDGTVAYEYMQLPGNMATNLQQEIGVQKNHSELFLAAEFKVALKESF